MEYSSPYNNYIVVMPDGDVKGFMETEMAQGYINRYYQERIDQYEQKPDYSDHDMTKVKSLTEICKNIGVAEGECITYDLDDFINKIQEATIFDEEKQEVISKLLQKNISLNVNDYQLENILLDVKVIMN